MNSKKITSSALAALMIAGTTSFTALAEMPVGTVVIGNKAIQMDWANKKENTLKVIEMMKAAQKDGGKIYIKAPNGMWFNNDSTTLSDTSVLPEVTYTDAEGTETKYAAGDKDEVVASEDLKVDSVSAISNTKIQVKLEEEVEAVNAASFELAKKNSDEAVEVTNAVIDEDNKKIVVIETEAMDGGNAYTLALNEEKYNFTALKKATATTKLQKAECTDNGVVTVEFKETVDEESAEDISNYSIDKNVEVVDAKLNSDRKSVDLTVEGLKRGSFRVTVENIKNVDGVEMKGKDSKPFVNKTFTKAPKVLTVKNRNHNNNNTLFVNFKSNHKLNTESAENIENYSIEGLNILEAKYEYNKSKDINRVILKTETQKSGNKYYLVVNNISDTSVSENTMAKEQKIEFRGGYNDRTAPSLVRTSEGKPKSISNTEIMVLFDEMNALDETTTLDPDNYSFNHDLEVESARFLDADHPYTEDGKTVILTTTPQDGKTTYKLTVKNIEDEYGNAMKSTVSSYGYVKGQDMDERAPYVTGFNAKDKETLEIQFDDALASEGALDPTNYEILNSDGDKVTSALAVEFVQGSLHSKVKVTVPTLDANKSYTALMNNITDMSENELNDVKVDFVAPINSNDTEKPQIDFVEYVSNKQIVAHFNEPVTGNFNMTFQNENDSTDKVTFASVISFENRSNVILTATNNKTLLNADYKLVAGTGAADLNIKDLNENKFVLSTDCDVLLNGSDFAGEMPLLEYAEQKDAKSIVAKFNEPVRFTTANPTVTATYKDGSSTKTVSFKARINGEYYNTKEYYDSVTYESLSTVKLTVASGVIPSAKDLEFNFSNSLKSYSGKTALDQNDSDTALSEKTVVSTFYEDKEKPFVEYAEAINEGQVKIVFSEDLSTKGSYKLYYYNDKGNKQPISLSTVGYYDGNYDQILASVPSGKKLDRNITYTLSVSTPPKDDSNNALDRNEVDIQFEGSNVKVQDFITSVEKVLANKISVAGVDLASSANVKVGTVNITAAHGVDTDNGTIVTAMPLLADETYVVNDGNNHTYSFKGFVDNEGGLETVSATTSSAVAVNFLDRTDKAISEDYVVKYWNGSAFATATKVTIYEKDENGVIKEDDNHQQIIKEYEYRITDTSLFDNGKEVYVFVYENATAENPIYGTKIAKQN